MTKIVSRKSIVSAAFALATVAATMTASAGSAEARWGHRGLFFGGLAGGLAVGLVGAAIANNAAASDLAYAEEDSFRYRRVCRMEPRYNDLGEFIGRVRICRTGY